MLPLMKKLRDITQPLHTDIAVWPGDPPFRFDRMASIDRGDPYNLGAISLGLHTGTHVDAPYHFDDAGATVADLSLAPFIGPCRVIHLDHPDTIGADMLAQHAHNLPACLLIRTESSPSDHFVSDFTCIDEAAANWIVEHKIQLLGIDTPSVDPTDSEHHPIHHRLLKAGIPILENLNLRDVPAGDYELIALPLRIEHAEAAPVRAVLRTLE